MSDPIRYFLAFLVPLVATLWVTPLAARLARRLGILDQPSEHKAHREPTPYLGGLALAAGLVVVGGAAAGASGQLLMILLGGIVLGLWGLVDDWVTVRPSVKLLVEAGAGLALWLAGVRAGLFDVYALDLALTLLWVIAVTNAVNLLDNMDGLSPGVAALSALTFFAIAGERGDYLVGSFALALAGASLGFLRHNFPPARIFLGDAGSLMLGFLLAAIGLKLDLVGESGLARSAIPVLILGVPIFDTALVIISRFRSGRPVYLGGTDHSSHRLARLGLTHRSVALATYSAQAICCAVAFWLLHAPVGFTLPIVLAICATAGLVAAALLELDEGQQAHRAQGEAALPGSAALGR